MVLGLPNIAAAGVALRPDLTGFGRSVERQLPGLLGPAAGAAGALIASGIGTAVAGLDAFGGFETNLQRIVGLVGVAQDEVDGMGESLKALAPTVGAGPEELAEALFFVTSAGLRGSEALDVVEASAKAAAAGLGDITTVADAATSAMNAYGADTLSAGDATDVLVATVREGKVEADSLAGAIGRVIPLAAEAGVSFNEVGAAIAATTRTGLGAEESVTALRGLFSTLVSPTSQARDVLNEYGLSAEGLRTQLREEGLLAVLQTLSGAFGGNIDALSGVIPNIRALTGFLSLTGSNAEDVVGIFERMGDVSGITDDALGAVADTTEFRLNQALARLKTELTDAGADAAPTLLAAAENILPVLVDLIPVLTDLGVSVVSLGEDLAFLIGPLRDGALFLEGLVGGLEDARTGGVSVGEALTTGFSALFGVPGLISAAVQGFDDTTKAVASLREELEGGRDPILALADTIVQFNREGARIDTEFLTRLQREAGLSNDEMRNVLFTILGAGDAASTAGLDVGQLTLAFSELTGVGDVFAGTGRNFARGARGAGRAASEAAGGVNELEGAAGDLNLDAAADEAGDLEQAFLDAAEAGESLRDVIKEQTDPVFAAVDGFLDYQKLLEEIEEDGKTTAQEQLELARAVISLGSDFDAAGGDIGFALDAIAAASGQTRDEVIADFEELGLEVGDTGIGAAIVDGILSDLDGLAGRMTRKLNSEVSGALDASKRRWGIQSPSTVFAAEFGRPIAEGIAAGIAEGAQAVRAALSDSVAVPTATSTTPPGGVRNFNITVVEPQTLDLERSVEAAVGVARTQDLLLGIE